MYIQHFYVVDESVEKYFRLFTIEEYYSTPQKYSITYRSPALKSLLK